MFITFEGGEGSGKTSVIKAISSLLTEKKIDHVTTREPGGSIIAEKIKKVILVYRKTRTYLLKRKHYICCFKSSAFRRGDFTRFKRKIK